MIISSLEQLISVFDQIMEDHARDCNNCRVDTYCEGMERIKGKLKEYTDAFKSGKATIEIYT